MLGGADNPNGELSSYITGADNRVMAMDIRLSHYAIMSDGAKVDNPRHLINASRNLRPNKKRFPVNKRKGRIAKRPESVRQPYASGWQMPVLIFNTSSLVQLSTKTRWRLWRHGKQPTW